MESSAPFVVYPPESDPKITFESLRWPPFSDLVKAKIVWFSSEFFDNDLCYRVVWQKLEYYFHSWGLGNFQWKLLE